MQPKTKLLIGLAISVFIPLFTAAIILQPGTATLTALFLVALLAIVSTWKIISDSIGLTRSTSPLSTPNPRGLLQQDDPDHLLNRIVSTIEETLADPSVGKEPIDKVSIRKKLYKNLGGFLIKKKYIPEKVEAKEVTVILADLRGFTNITENYSALEVVDMLNRYFTIMCEIIYHNGGMVDKFVGDSIMALFGVPESREKDVEHALCCAVEMQLAMNTFNKENKKRSMPDQYMGIGINTGQVIAGKVGSALHSEYTVIGDEINKTSRIEAYTLRGQILISSNTYSKAKNLVTVNDPIHISVKGKRDPLCIYELLAIGKPYNLKVPEREIRRSLRVEVNIPFKFHICIGKIVSSDSHEGRILNVSAGGIRACTLTEVEPHLNIKFKLKSTVTGIEGDDIYGKIVNVVKKDELYETNIEFTAISSKDSGAIKELVNSVIQGSYQ